MKFEIRKDIPVKYECGAHVFMSEYPSDFDVLFDVCKYVTYKKKRKRRLSAEDFNVPMTEIAAMYADLGGDKMSLVKESLKKLHDGGDVFLEDENVKITEKGIKKIYAYE